MTTTTTEILLRQQRRHYSEKCGDITPVSDNNKDITPTTVELLLRHIGDITQK